MPIMKRFFLLLALGFSMSACTAKNSTNSDLTKSTASARVVRLAVWSNYVTPEILSEFEKKTGVRVEVSNYSSNEELLAKLQAGASGYDVVVPSDYMVLVMSKMGLIRKLELSKIPNAKSLDPRYLKKSYDPMNEYSLPYDVGTSGIAINRDLYSGTIKSWKDLFSNPELNGKVSLLDDSHEVIGAALKSMGYSMNSRDSEQLKKAKELLIQVRPQVKAFTSEAFNLLVNREVAVAHAFVMDALQARKVTGGKIDYILPEEGSSFYIDNLAIPSTVVHPEEAHALINFLLDAKVEAPLASRLFLAPSNPQAFSLLPPSFRVENAILFPKGNEERRLEMLEDLGEASQAYDRIWTDVKAVGL